MHPVSAGFKITYDPIFNEREIYWSRPYKESSWTSTNMNGVLLAL